MTDTPAALMAAGDTASAIKATALDRLRTHGTGGLGMRAIARDLGLSPGAAYRHFDGIDGLLTALVADGYEALADAMATAVACTGDHGGGSGPAPSARAAWLAYRDWAVANPHLFGLLFGPPIPGYAAPPDGPTTAGMARVGELVTRPLVELAMTGQLRPLDTRPDGAATRKLLAAEFTDMLPPGVPPATAPTMLRAWGRMHGLVCLEVFGHLAWVLDDAGDLYRAELDDLTRDLGFDD